MGPSSPPLCSSVSHDQLKNSRTRSFDVELFNSSTKSNFRFFDSDGFSPSRSCCCAGIKEYLPAWIPIFGLSFITPSFLSKYTSPQLRIMSAIVVPSSLSSSIGLPSLNAITMSAGILSCLSLTLWLLLLLFERFPPPFNRLHNRARSSCCCACRSLTINTIDVLAMIALLLRCRRSAACCSTLHVVSGRPKFQSCFISLEWADGCF